IVKSKGLVLEERQMDLSMAVNMEIARRAAVFIGNGMSSGVQRACPRAPTDTPSSGPH
ncbi:hypothetical protein B0H14DRAFT_2336813, partial [Mycena olivaceomarginata]